MTVWYCFVRFASFSMRRPPALAIEGLSAMAISGGETQEGLSALSIHLFICSCIHVFSFIYLFIYLFIYIFCQ